MNHALRIHAYGGADAVLIDGIGVPAAGPGEVVARVRADATQLAQIACEVVQGELNAEVPEVIGRSEAAEAIERNKTSRGLSRTVVKFQ